MTVWGWRNPFKEKLTASVLPGHLTALEQEASFPGNVSTTTVSTVVPPSFNWTEITNLQIKRRSTSACLWVDAQVSLQHSVSPAAVGLRIVAESPSGVAYAVTSIDQMGHVGVANYPVLYRLFDFEDMRNLWGRETGLFIVHLDMIMYTAGTMTAVAAPTGDPTSGSQTQLAAFITGDLSA